MVQILFIYIYNTNPDQNSRQQKTDIFHKCQQTWDRMLSVLQPLTDYRLTESLMRWSQTRVFVCASWVDGDRYPEALWNICDTESVTRWDSLLCLKQQQFVTEKLTYSMSTLNRKRLLQTHMNTQISLILSYCVFHTDKQSETQETSGFHRKKLYLSF